MIRTSRQNVKGISRFREAATVIRPLISRLKAARRFSRLREDRRVAFLSIEELFLFDGFDRSRLGVFDRVAEIFAEGLARQMALGQQRRYLRRAQSTVSIEPPV